MISRKISLTTDTTEKVVNKLVESLSYSLARKPSASTAYTSEQACTILSGCALGGVLVAYYGQHEAVIRPLVESALPAAIARQLASI